MKSKFISLLAVILGLIIIIFPVMGIIGVSDLIGLSILLISIYLLVVGVAIIDYNKSGAILDLVLGMLLLFLSICLIFNAGIFGFLAQITLYLAGIMLIVVGLVSLINNRQSRYGFYIGIAGVVLGLVYIVIGTYVANPILLGALIGAWLVISGILRLMKPVNLPMSWTKKSLSTSTRVSVQIMPHFLLILMPAVKWRWL